MQLCLCSAHANLSIKNTAWISWQKFEFNENNCLVSIDCNYAKMLLCAFSLNIFFGFVWWCTCKVIAYTVMIVDGKQIPTRWSDGQKLVIRVHFWKYAWAKRKNVFNFACSSFVAYLNDYYNIAHSLWGWSPTSFYSVLELLQVLAYMFRCGFFSMVIGYWPLP